MRGWLAGLSIAGCAAAGTAVGAQSRGSCPAASAEPYLLCQVDATPKADSTNRAPSYTSIMFDVNKGAVVRAAFVVDSTGRVPARSLRVETTAHEVFASAVRSAVRSWRFEPAQRERRPVAVQYEHEFAFEVPADSVVIEEFIVVRHDTTAEGVPRTRIGRAERPRISVSFANEELAAAQLSALLVAAPKPPVANGRTSQITLCLTLLADTTSVPADAATIRALRLPHRRIVSPKRCPRTYTSMVYDPANLAPKGYIDPFHVSVKRVVPWNASTVIVDIDEKQGTTMTGRRCIVTRDTGSWQARCRVYTHLVS